MKQSKISLENVQGKLSRSEMKNIMAGDAPVGCKTSGVCKTQEECCEDQGYGCYGCSDTGYECGKF